MKLIGCIVIVFLSFYIQAQIDLGSNIQMIASFESRPIKDSISEMYYNSRDTSDSDVVDFPDIQASFVGGYNAMVSFIGSNLEFSSKKLSKLIKRNGAITMTYMFAIDTDGRLFKLTIYDDGNYSKLDKELKRIIRLGEWLVGESMGAPVISICTLKIVFDQK